MGSIMNGMAVSGLLPAGGTFFVFSDYMRPRGAPRRAVAVQDRVRVDPRLGRRRRGRPDAPADRAPRCAARRCRACASIRPADANETAHAWRLHIDGDGPTAIVLTRQNAPGARGHRRARRRRARRAGRTCSSTSRATRPTSCSSAPAPRCRCASTPPRALVARGRSVRVVSMPSWELFDAQPADYRDAVLPAGVPTLAVEAGATLRVGALRRRRRGHRPLRRVGAGRHRARRVRVHRRQRRRARHARLLDATEQCQR